MTHYCLFDDERRFVMCVDPKCGCTTIQEWFGRIVGLRPDQNQLSIAHWMKHPADVWAADGYVRVWFVRDPFRRLVSFFYQFVVHEKPLWCFADHAKTQRLEGATFQEFVRLLGDLAHRNERLQHHLEPQTRSLLGLPFDRIIKIEELDSRADELIDLLQVDARPGHHNRQAPGGELIDDAWTLHPQELAERGILAYDSFWNDELSAIVSRVYAGDCALYEDL